MDGAQGRRMQAPSEHIFGDAEAQGGKTPTMEPGCLLAGVTQGSVG